jgi:hypothetical protein
MGLAKNVSPPCQRRLLPSAKVDIRLVTAMRLSVGVPLVTTLPRERGMRWASGILIVPRVLPGRPRRGGEERVFGLDLAPLIVP